MLTDISLEDIQEWVSDVLFNLGPDDRTTGRVLIFGPVSSFNARGQSRCRLDFDTADPNVDATTYGRMVFSAMERYAEEGGTGYVFAVAYRTGDNSILSDKRGRVVSTEGDEDVAMFGAQPAQMVNPFAAANRAIDANTKVTLKTLDALIESMKANVTLGNNIGRLEGSLAEAARGATIRAQAELAETLMPSVDKMVTSLVNLAAIHLKSKNNKGEEVGGDQPDDLGEERVMWDIALISALLADLLKHGMEKKEAFTTKAVESLKAVMSEAMTLKSLAEAMGTT